MGQCLYAQACVPNTKIIKKIEFIFVDISPLNSWLDLRPPLLVFSSLWLRKTFYLGLNCSISHPASCIKQMLQNSYGIWLRLVFTWSKPSSHQYNYNYFLTCFLISVLVSHASLPTLEFYIKWPEILLKIVRWVLRAGVTSHSKSVSHLSVKPCV